MAIVLVLLCLFAEAEAQAVADSLVERRIQYLKNSLLQDQRATQKWWMGWMAGYGIATISQSAILFSTEETALKQDMAVGAITTFAGMVGQLISPFQPESFAPKVILLPETSKEQQVEKLMLMEKMVDQRAALEIKARKWQAHILCTGVNLASGMVTWLGFHRTVWDGVANFAFNCVITEAQIWSQPLRAPKELKRYHERFGENYLARQSNHEFHWNFVVSGNRAGVKILF